MSNITDKITTSLQDIGLDESAEKVRNQVISESLSRINTGIRNIKAPVHEAKKLTKPEAKERYGQGELADVARNVYKININPPEKKEEDIIKPTATPNTAASRANMKALSKALAGERAGSGNIGKPAPTAGFNGVGNTSNHESPVGEDGIGNVGTNTEDGQYYALTTDMTLEQYREYVEGKFIEEGCGCEEETKSEKKHPKGCECEECGVKKEDVVVDLEQRLVTLGNIDWVEVDKCLREVASTYNMLPKHVSKAFREEHGVYPDKWIKENLQIETCGVMPLGEAKDRIGGFYEVTFMFRGGQNRLKFFWPEVDKPTKASMQNAVEKFWPRAKVVTFYPSKMEDEFQINENEMVMVPPTTENYNVLSLADWNEMSEYDSQIFYTICEEEGEPLGSPELNDDGTYQVHIMDHDTGEERVVFFGG